MARVFAGAESICCCDGTVTHVYRIPATYTGCKVLRKMKKTKGTFFVLLLVMVLGVSTFFLERSVTYAANEPIPPEVTQHAKDWPLPNRDYGNTRFTADATINTSNVGSLKLEWSFKIPGIGVYGGGASNPIIMGDNIYFQDLKANVFSLNLRDGHVNWQKIYNNSAVVGPNGPAVGWNKVFVAKDLYTIAALNSSTGEEIWATKISNVNTTGIDIQPSVYDNMIYVSTVPGTGDIFYAPGGIGVIYALDQTTGNVMWNFSTVDTPNLWGHPEINSGGGCWYTPAIDTNSGVTFWGISNPAPFPGIEGWPSGSSRPGPNLYTNTMMALYHNNGTMKWFNQVLPHDIFDHDLQIAPILAKTKVNGSQQDIVIGAGKMGTVYAFNRDTGTLLWHTNVGEHQNDTLTVLPLETPESSQESWEALRRRWHIRFLIRSYMFLLLTCSLIGRLQASMDPLSTSPRARVNSLLST